MRGKHGISAIVATVLIVLIAVVAITAIWLVIIPMIGEGVEDVRSAVVLSIVSSEGYTVWDEENRIVSVHVKRGNDGQDIIGFDLIFTIGGNSVRHYEESVLDINSKKVYYVNLSEYPGELESIKIAPVFVGGEIGDVVGEVKIGEIKKASLVDIVEEVEVDIPEPNEGIDNVIECYGGEVVYGDECAIVVNAMVVYDLDQGDRVYILNRSIIYDEIIISEDDIMLDGRGFSLIGDGSGNGVSASGLTGLTIKNFGDIGNFEKGIYFDDVSDSVISDNVMSSEVALTTYAIYLENGDSNTIENNVIDWNATGAGNPSSGIILIVDEGQIGNNNNIVGNDLNIFSDHIASGVSLYNLGISDNNVFESNIVNVVSKYIVHGIMLTNNYLSISSNLNIIKSNVINISSTSDILGDGFGISLLNYGPSMNSNIIQDNVLDVDLSSAQYSVGHVIGLQNFNPGIIMNSNLIQSNIMSSVDADGIYLSNPTFYDSKMWSTAIFDNNACGIVDGSSVSCTGVIYFNTSSGGNKFDNPDCSTSYTFYDYFYVGC